MKIIFIIFILSFLAACSSNESGKTLIPSRERLHRRVKAKKNTVVGKSVKATSRPPNINPFLTKEEEASTSRYDRLLTLNLSAIFYSPPDSKVIIDGHILKEGDVIDNKMVKEIRPAVVILKDSVREYIVEMKNYEN